MAAEKPVLVSVSDISPGFGSDTVVITSPELVEGLIHDQSGALAVLTEQGATVELTDISIDALGRVVIRNQAFVDELRRKSEQEAAGSNWICGFRCSLA